MLTKSQIDLYRARDGMNCPYCGSDRITVPIIDLCGVEVVQPCQCEECGVMWEDVYELVTIRETPGNGQMRTIEVLVARDNGSGDNGTWDTVLLDIPTQVARGMSLDTLALMAYAKKFPDDKNVQAVTVYSLRNDLMEVTDEGSDRTA